MATTILIKRNTLANIGTLTAGELYLATDTLDLYIGSASGNKLIGGIAALLAKVNKAGDTMTGQLISTLAIGTSPLAVTSTTVNTNLNADMVDGIHASSFALLSGATFTGSMIVKTVNDAGPMTATNGTVAEIVFNSADTSFYGCSVTGTPATWVKLG